MLKGKVIGNIVSTNKLDKLVGYKFLEIQIIEKNELTDKFIALYPCEPTHCGVMLIRHLRNQVKGKSMGLDF